MIHRLWIMVRHDVAVSIQNKTVALLVFIPLLICLSIKMVDDTTSSYPRQRLGFIANEVYPDAIVENLKTSQIFDITELPDEVAGTEALKAKRIDAYLRPKGAQVELIVFQKETIATLILVQNISEVQKATLQLPKDWVSSIISLRGEGLERASLTTWVLTIILMVGLILIPAQIAEEKEKHQLSGILQTPLSEVEWLISKLCTSMILSTTSIALLHTVSGVFPNNTFGYLIIILCGSLYATAVGSTAGLLCKTQASARAVGVVLYLPHLLPLALSDFSQKLNSISNKIPTHMFFEPMKSLLMDKASLWQFRGEALTLLGFALLFSVFSVVILKRRWRF